MEIIPDEARDALVLQPARGVVMPAPAPDAEMLEENRRLRRLQMLVGLVSSAIVQGALPLEEASQLVVSTRVAALNLFPGKELAFDLIYQPRLQRLLRETYRIN